MELGLGIHGEPGVKRTLLQPADELSETLLTEILSHGKLGDDKRAVVMINNLGATTEMELAIVARHVSQFLGHEGISVERIYAGTFLSSLDMAGISISLLGASDMWLRWLDAPTSAPSWPKLLKKAFTRMEIPVAPIVKVSPTSLILTDAKTEAGRVAKLAIQAACDALIEAESELTELDRITGDGGQRSAEFISHGRYPQHLKRHWGTRSFTSH